MCLTESVGNENGRPIVSPVVLSIKQIRLSKVVGGKTVVSGNVTNVHNLAVSW